MATDSAPPSRLERTLDRLWAIAAAPQALIALATVLAGSLAVAAIFPQAPAGLTAAGTDQWLANTAAAYRAAGPFLRSIGVFQVLDGLVLRMLLAAAAFSLALRSAAQVRFLWSLRTARRAVPAPPPGLPTGHASLPVPLEDALSRVQVALAQRGLLPPVEQASAAASIHATHRAWAAAGPLAVYLGLLLVLVGLFVQSLAGWSAANLALARGDTALLGGGDLRLTLDALEADPAAPVQARAVLSTQTGETSSSLLLGFARPALWRGVWVVQKATGPALAVSADEAAGRPLLLQALSPAGEIGETVRVRFQQTESEQGFAIPTRNLTFRAVSYAALPEQGIDRPVFLVEGYRGDEAGPSITGLIEDAATLELDGVTVTLQRDRYVVLTAAFVPGLWLMALGGLLLLAGAALSAYGGPVRWWARVSPAGAGSTVELVAAAPWWPVEDASRESTRVA